MPNANDIHGTVYKNRSATLLAKVVGASAAVVTQATIASAKYTAYLLAADPTAAPDTADAITGHTDVTVAVASLIYDTLQTDAVWTKDGTGYNLKHVLDVGTTQLFTIAGRWYLVEFMLTPTSGQIIPVRFRLLTI